MNDRPNEEENKRLNERLGRMIGGKYILESLLGQGGAGAVYRAAHVDLGEPVAVKFLAAVSPESRQRFQREARTLARLRHPGIVSVLDFGEDGGEPYLVMELVSGVLLADVILVNGLPLTFPRITSITREILKILEATHRADVVHRDLKPENIMLADPGGASEHVKILDFGIALVREAPGDTRLTATQTVHGTPAYMSPEQCRGRDVGPPTDIYAVSAILYEMLAGEPPFDGTSAVELMTQHLFLAASPVVERGVGRPVPLELEQLAMMGLAKQAEDRPTARDMLEELDRYTRGVSLLGASARAAEERIRAVGLSRSQRVLPRDSTAPPQGRSRDGAAPDSGVEGAWIDAWGIADARLGELRNALAVHGLGVREWRGDTPPPATVGSGEVVRAVLLADGADVADKLRALRGRAGEGAAIPVLVGDATPAHTALLVREGASDVALAGVGDEIVCGKLLRMIRRKR